MLEVSLSDGDIVFLVIYQDGLGTYSSQSFSQVSENDIYPGRLVLQKTLTHEVCSFISSTYHFLVQWPFVGKLKNILVNKILIYYTCVTFVFLVSLT